MLSEWFNWWPFWHEEKRLDHLIAEADANPKDAIQQGALIAELNKHNPEAVIKRFERMDHAVDSRGVAEYIKALVVTNAMSKMFVLGTKALEQFIDRLIEWPQYCNHILQISHLCGTHAELVALIEGALARISSSHSELDLGQVAAVDHHHNSTPAAHAEVIFE